jgi:hypothetical protein
MIRIRNAAVVLNLMQCRYPYSKRSAIYLMMNQFYKHPDPHCSGGSKHNTKYSLAVPVSVLQQ